MSNAAQADQSASPSDQYIDAKWRVRWQVNDALAEKLKELYDFLVIGNYEESHATRYPRLAHTISRYPESVDVMKAEGRLSTLPGVSNVIEGILTELLETGTCQKMTQGDETYAPPPRTVLELTQIPRLGAKTARALYQEHGVDGLSSLRKAFDDDRLASVKGIGKGMLETIRKHLEANGHA